MEAISISPGRLLKILLGIDAGLIAANLIGCASVYLLDGGGVSPLAWRFIFEAESSLPTWYSSIQLLTCAILLFSIGLESRRLRQVDFRHWWGLSAMFAYISIDEVATFRETLAELSKAYVETSGLFYSNWVIVAIPAVALLALLYAKFLIRLPRPIGFLSLLSGGLFVAGGLGFEMIGALFQSNAGFRDLSEAPAKIKGVYALISTMEESLEIVGVTVFLYALLSYVKLKNFVALKANIL